MPPIKVPSTYRKLASWFGKTPLLLITTTCELSVSTATLPTSLNVQFGIRCGRDRLPT